MLRPKAFKRGSASYSSLLRVAARGTGIVCSGRSSQLRNRLIRAGGREGQKGQSPLARPPPQQQGYVSAAPSPIRFT